MTPGARGVPGVGVHVPDATAVGNGGHWGAGGGGAVVHVAVKSPLYAWKTLQATWAPAGTTTGMVETQVSVQVEPTLVPMFAAPATHCPPRGAVGPPTGHAGGGGGGTAVQTAWMSPLQTMPVGEHVTVAAAGYGVW